MGLRKIKRQRKVRKRAAYMPYDYEAAYNEQIEKLTEDSIERMLKESKAGCTYATKEVKSGEQLEVEIYPEFTKVQQDEIPEEGRRERNRRAQRNLNEKNSRKQCERVINANFGNRDIWATLTYMDETMPTNMKEARRDMQNYIKRVNYYRAKQGLANARYVYVTECSAKGRWHHHLVMDGDMDMDTVESLWQLGRRNQVRRLQKDENGLVGMAKYLTKQGKEVGKYQKSWTPSKGLIQPEEQVNHYKFQKKDVHAVVRGEESLEEKLVKWYGSSGYTYVESEIRYNEVNKRFYIYARMQKPEEQEGGKIKTDNAKKPTKKKRKRANKAKNATNTCGDCVDNNGSTGSSGDRVGDHRGGSQTTDCEKAEGSK